MLSKLPEAAIRCALRIRAILVRGLYRMVATIKGVRRLQPFSSFVAVRRTMFYSYRSAFIGSTREALRAGIRAASMAIAINEGTTSK